MDAIGNRSHPVDQLVDEKQMLRSLLYRNKNQHMKTVIYKHLCRVDFYLARIPLEFLNDMTKQCENMMKHINQLDSRLQSQRTQIHDQNNVKKILSNDVQSRLETLCTDSLKVVSVCCYCAQWCLLTSEKIRGKLRQLLFVPLYTVWLCNVARIFSASLKLIKSFFSYYEMFSLRVKVDRNFLFDDEVSDILKLVGLFKIPSTTTDAIASSSFPSSNESINSSEAYELLQTTETAKTSLSMPSKLLDEDTGECMLPVVTTTPNKKHILPSTASRKEIDNHTHKFKKSKLK